MKKIICSLLIAMILPFFAIAQNETFHLTNPTLIECNLIRVSPPIRTLTNDNAPMGPNYRTSKGLDLDKEEEGQIRVHKAINPNALPKGISPAVQMIYNKPGSIRTPAILNLDFPGQGYTGVNPSDVNMASGPNHIVQMINNNSSSRIRIWDKAGNILVNSLILSTITGVSGLGDPVVLYDQAADRYLLSEFANVGNHILICVSQTNDPTGSYYVYNYTTPNFPDYFKLGTWGNSYIVTSNENSPALYALDRTKMLAGIATTVTQRFTIPSYPTIGFQSATPVDFTGTTPVPAGAPAMFMRMADDAWTTGIVDRLEIFSLNVDWVTPANTTLTGPLLLPTLPFSTNFCGYITFSCIPQMGSSVKLDPLREVLMNKIIYRNFGTHESIVCTHIDELDGNSHAGVRWYELRRTGSNPWTIYQQGTYGAPADPTHRWMSTIGIDPNGSIALGYNVAGPNNFPSIRFTGRRNCDPLNQMTEPETTVIAGTSPNASNRYGDYNGMTIDPVDGSFWMTANYNPSTQWATRVANLSLNPSCGGCSPSIVTQPNSTALCAGGNTSFSVAASGSPLTYQWELSTAGAGGPWNPIANGGVYGGATTATLTLTGVLVTMNNYQYRCVITGTCAPTTATTNAVVLTVNPATSINTQPGNSIICSGASTSFGVAATGTALTYQWQVSTTGIGGPWTTLTNVAPYSNVTTATMNITNATATLNGYYYRCVVGSSCTPVNSNPALLTVNSTPAVATNPGNTSVCAGNPATFTVAATGGGLTYQWQESTTGAGGPWNTLTNVAPYSNVTTATMTINPAAVGMNAYQYRCVVNGACPGTATSNPGILTVGTALSITAQPNASVLCAGANTSFSITITGTATGYQWQESTSGAGGPWNNIINGGVYSGATTTTLTLTGVLAGMNNYQYRCVVSGSCPSINSNPALLTVNTAPNISGQPANSTICAAQNSTFTVTASGTALTYQWQESTTGCAGPWNNITNGGIYSGATTVTLTLTGAPATMNGYGYRCLINGTCTPASTTNCASLTVNTGVNITTQPLASTVCAGANTSFSVAATGTTPTYQWQLSTTGAGGPWNNIANGGVYSGATTNTLSLTGVTAGMNNYQYRCVVSGAAPCGSLNSGNAILTVNTAPAITTQPVAGSTICEGQSTSYSVIANGTALSYQWQLSTAGAGGPWNNITNGGVYSGATTATLNITAATPAMNTYQYRCLINGTCTPAATSTSAILTVHTAITTTGPTDATICATGTTSFSVNAAGTSPTYQWQLSTTGPGGPWTNITNGGVYGGTTTATLTLTGVTTGMDTYRYRCVVTGTVQCGAVNSIVAALTVSPRPTVTLTASPYTRLRPGLPVNPPVTSMVTTTITATVTPATGFTTAWTWNSAPLTVTGNSYQVDLNHLGIYTVIATIGSCTSLPANIVIGDSASTKLWIYPSPNSGIFTVSYYSPGASQSNKTTQTITVYASDGRRVYSQKLDVNQPYQLHQIDLRRNGADIYYVVLREANGNKIKTGEVVVR